MIIFPAIDLYGGKAVRLLCGNYEDMTVYSDDPASVARDFISCGATHIHLVDLEGARDGGTPNMESVRRILSETKLFSEIGGGIRDMKTASAYLDAGVSRIILGTAALDNEMFLRESIAEFGNRIAVGADCRDGFISTKGWTETSSCTLNEFMSRMQSIGVSNVICTDISRDGAMRGTNRVLYRELSDKYSINITASGGVSTMEDVKALREIDLYGCIIGKAYYTGAINLAEAIGAAK